jgi:hypothetical protein
MDERGRPAHDGVPVAIRDGVVACGWRVGGQCIRSAVRRSKATCSPLWKVARSGRLAMLWEISGRSLPESGFHDHWNRISSPACAATRCCRS